MVGIYLGDVTYWCRSCFQEDGAAQLLCRICYAAEREQHKKSHDFACVQAFRNETEASIEEHITKEWHCPQCPMKSTKALTAKNLYNLTSKRGVANKIGQR